ncbi:uncharacterized protein LOC103837195 [Brassica rapa]|uniref:uncharacterized protein LOC103837195 n=1 Tax=Brassica campestris TaxID=3711 RepID=UPI0004F16E18|nr:uncharacterized protein LOC103837195 [Brassica rapa]
MENQVMSAASSSVAQLEKCNDINVAVEESKETATENNNPGLGSDSQEVVSERRSENPSLGSGAVPTGNGYICRFCNKWWPTSQSLGGHMNSHTRELQWERKQKEMEQFHRQWTLSQYSQGGLEPIPSYNNYPPMLPRNVPPFPPHRTTNLPSYWYPHENVLNEEDVILKLGNDNIVEIDDDDDDADADADAVDQPEEGTSKSWGADLSL